MSVFHDEKSPPATRETSATDKRRGARFAGPPAVHPGRRPKPVPGGTLPTIRSIDVPAHSHIHQYLAGAYFHDCYEMPLKGKGQSAMALYLDSVAGTPAWVNRLMLLRNQLARAVRLKNLGSMMAVDRRKPASAYRVGDRVGIFSVFSIDDDEVILTDADKHLTAKVSVCKVSHGALDSMVVSTVVHVKNRLGRFYMLLVTPLHRRIVPAVLARSRFALRTR